MKNRGISTMDAACSTERRAFLKAFTTTTAALAVGACGGVKVGDTAPAPGAPAIPAGNVAPVWLTVPTITFTLGVPGNISIAAYVSDPNGDALTIVKNVAALPAGVTFDAANKRFVYDGLGGVGSTSGHVLTANDGKP
jgi:hypothetical protein